MWCNTQVTYSPSTANARSESELETDPRNPFSVVGSSKRFNNILTYDFTLGVYASTDGGESWIEAPPLVLLGDPDPNKRWAGISDPVLAFDNAGGCYLVALPFPGPGSPFTTLGIAVYKSTDGGATWGAPNFIHPNTTSTDDKQWAASDRNPSSKFYGNVYIAWDNGVQLAFARTTDHGATWTGYGNKPVGEPLAFDSFAPSIAVMDDGSVCIFWIAGNVIKFVKSTNLAHLWAYNSLDVYHPLQLIAGSRGIGSRAGTSFGPWCRLPCVSGHRRFDGEFKWSGRRRAGSLTGSQSPI